MLNSNRGVIRWPEIEFGQTVKLECPYGLTSNVTALASEHKVPTLETHFYYYFEWNKDIFIAPKYKRSALLKSNSFDKDKEFNSTSNARTKTQRMLFLERKLRFSNEDKAHAVRTCMLSNGTAVWSEVVDDLCKEEVW